MLICCWAGGCGWHPFSNLSTNPQPPTCHPNQALISPDGRVSSFPLRLVGVQRQSACYIVSGYVDGEDGGGGLDGRGNAGRGRGDWDGAPRTDDVLLLTKRPVVGGELANGGEDLGSLRLLVLVLHSEPDPPGSSSR
jgi:hypothetical protein